MKTPTKAQLEANALRQIDHFSRMHLIALRDAARKESQDRDASFENGLALGFQCSIAILVSDLGIGSPCFHREVPHRRAA